MFKLRILRCDKTLFGLCGGMIKQSSAECDEFFSSDGVFKRVIEAVNKLVDVGEE